MTSRFGTFLAKRQLTAAAATPITLPLNAVMAFGFVERAVRASERLKALGTALWKTLCADNLDLLAVLVEDLIEKMEQEKVPLRLRASPDSQSRGGPGGHDGRGSSRGMPPVNV